MPRIDENLVNDIRQKINIVEIVKEYVSLTKKGSNYVGICPFHKDHSPSMSVSEEKQIFKCFSCGVAGNVFKFLSDIENISYKEAIGRLASRVGIQVSLGQESEKVTKFESEYQIMNLSMLYFANNLNTTQGDEARKYLHQRGLNDEMIEEFNLGLSFSNNHMLEFFRKKKVEEKDLLSLGLINQHGIYYHDVFQNRILFPIHNPDGRVVGFTGRVYEKDGTPRYLNSKETILFKKGNILFNYHRAKDAIRNEKKLIIVEGNMDAIRMYASDFKNTIALMGTSLTKEQIYLIEKLRVPITLMFDNDAAGDIATYNNGLLLENRGLQVDVVRLSGEKDPDEYIIKNGVERMRENLLHPISFMEFKLSYLKENKNLEDTSQLAEYVKNVLKTLEGKDAITIDVTLNKLASEYHLSYEILKQQLHETEIKQPIIEPKEIILKKNTKYEVSALHILYYMMNDEKYILKYKKELGFFREELYRGIANEILYYYEKYHQIEFADFLNYVESSPLKNEIYEVLKSIKNTDLDETSMNDYMFNIKESTWKSKILELQKEIKITSDVYKKELIGKDILEISKKIQEIKKERSEIK